MSTNTENNAKQEQHRQTYERTLNAPTNTNHTRDHKTYRSTRNITINTKHTDKHMHVPQQQICTTQENVSKSYFLYARYSASHIKYDLLCKFFRFIQAFVFLFRIPLDQYTPE